MVNEKNAKRLTIYIGGMPPDGEILSILAKAQQREKIDRIVDSLRWRKSLSEIQLIRMAAQWSAESALSGMGWPAFVSFLPCFIGLRAVYSPFI